MGFLSPKTPDSVQEAPRLESLEVTDSAYGRDIPSTFGTFRVGGNIIWASEIEEVRTETSEHTGGKGGRGGGTTTRIEYEYFASFAVAFGRGVAQDVLRIWADTELVFDESEGLVRAGTQDNFDEDYGVDPPRFGGGGPFGLGTYYGHRPQITGLHFRFYPGDETQIPDSLIIDSRGTAAPAFRGMCYIVFERIALNNYGNRIPSISAEINFGDTQADLQERFSIEVGTVPPPVGTIGDGAYMEVDHDRGILFERRHMYDANTLGFIRHLLPNHPAGSASTSAIIGLDTSSNQVALRSNNGIHICTSDTGRQIAYRPYIANEEIYAMVGAANGTTAVWFGINSHINGSYRVGYYSVNRATGVLERTGAVTHPAGRGVCSIAIDTDLPTVYVLGHDDDDLYITYHTILPTGAIDSSTYVSATPEQIDEDADNFINYQADKLGRIYVDQSTGSVLLAVQLDTGFRLIRLRGYNTTFQTKFEQLQEWSVTVPFIDYGGRWASPRLNRINSGSGGSLVMSNSGTGNVNRLAQVELTTGKLSGDPHFSGQQAVSAEFMNNAAGHTVWDDENNTLFYVPVGSESPAKAVIGGRARSGTTIKTFLQILAARTGLDPYADIAYDGPLGDLMVDGYRIEKQVRASKAIEPVLNLHFIDVIDNSRRLLFKRRPDDTRTAIHEDEFVRVNEDVEQYSESRKQESELPSVLNVDFVDTDLNYQTSTAQHRRPGAAAVGQHKESIQLPVSMSATVAKNTAVRHLQVRWAERSQFSYRLSQRYLRLEPADTLDIELKSGERIFMRINELDIGADFNIDIEAVRENPGQYDSDLSADGGILIPRLLPRGVDTEFIPVESTLLYDVDEPSTPLPVRYYTAGSKLRNDDVFWKGASVYESPDGSAYDILDPVTNQSPRGVIIVPPPNPVSYWRIQRASMDVDMYYGIDQLESITLQALVNGLNSFAVIRSNGQVALIQAQTVEVLDTYTVRLSNLVRGRRGTELMDRDLAIGDRIVLITKGSVYMHTQSLDTTNDERRYKAVSFGQGFEDADDTPARVTARALMPYAPVHARYDDTTLTWIRRTRIGGESDLSDLGGVPDVRVSEDNELELYEVDIIADDGIAVARTHNMITTPSLNYSVANARSDGILGNTLTVVIYQISGSVGRGFPGRFEFDIA